MNAARKRTLADLIILALLPIPIVMAGLLIIFMYGIMSEARFSFSDNNDDSNVAPIVAVDTLPAQVAAMATVNAAPQRESAAAPVAAPAEGAGEAAVVEVAAVGSYSEAQVEAGRSSYLSICAACHGTDARGIQGLGKTLINSEFVRSLQDDELHDFVVVGRAIWDVANTTGVAMPARGGNPGLSDEGIYDIIAYIRSVDAAAGGPTDTAGATVASAEPNTDAAEVADTEANAEEPDLSFDADAVAAIVSGSSGEAAEGSAEEPDLSFDADAVAAIVSGSSGEAAEETSPSDEFVVADVSALLASLGVVLPDAVEQPTLDGEQIYNAVCGHRPADFADGIYQMPDDFCDFLVEATANDRFSDDELLAMLQTGVPLWSAENEMGIHIPARAGYHALSDEDLQAFIDYLHTLDSE